MPDYSTAVECISMYAEKNLTKPDKSMTKKEIILASQRWCAIDILTEYLYEHWFESTPSDLVYRFVMYWERISKVTTDMFPKIVFQVSKEIFYYFV